jgi:hypothetical protein
VIQVTRHQKKWLLILFLCGVTYLLFHKIRFFLPVGFIKNSLPSVLVIPVMLSVVELTPSIRFHTLGSKMAITFFSTIGVAIWFEGVVPIFYLISIPDIGDVLGIFLGWIVYMLISYEQHFNKNYSGNV